MALLPLKMHTPQLLHVAFRLNRRQMHHHCTSHTMTPKRFVREEEGATACNRCAYCLCSLILDDTIAVTDSIYCGYHKAGTAIWFDTSIIANLGEHIVRHESATCNPSSLASYHLNPCWPSKPQSIPLSQRSAFLLSFVSREARLDQGFPFDVLCDGSSDLSTHNGGDEEVECWVT